MNVAVKLGYLIAVITGLVLLVVLHRPPAWFPLVMEEYTRILWTVDLALGTVIVGYTWLIFDDPPWVTHFVKAVLNTLALLAIYSVYRVFPFRFGAPFWEQLTRIVLLIAAAASLVGTIVDMSRLLTSREGEPQTKQQHIHSGPRTGGKDEG